MNLHSHNIKLLNIFSLIFIFISFNAYSNPPAKLNWSIEDMGYYYDWTGQLGPIEIPQFQFTKCSMPFKPGFYKGNLWLDLTVKIEGEKFCYINLGGNPIEIAEAFLFYDGKWTRLGKTGRRLGKKDLSIRTIDHCFPLELYDYKTPDNLFHFRIKMNSSTGDPFQFSLLSLKDFHRRANTFTLISMLAEAVLSIFALFFITAGILRRDGQNLSIGAMTVFIILGQLQMKGFGNLFIWPWLGQYFNSAKFGFVLYEIAIIFMNITLLNTFRDNTSYIHAKKIITIFMLPLVAFIFIITITTTNYFFLNLSYNLMIIVETLFATVIAVFCTRKNSFKIKLFMTFWGPAFLLLCIRQLFQELRLYLPNPVFSIFDNDHFLSYDLIYILVLLPSATLSTLNLKVSNTENESSLVMLRNQNRRLQEELEFTNVLMTELYDLSNVAMNTMHLPESTLIEDNEKRRNLIEMSLLQSTDFLNAALVLNQKITATKNSIKLLSFFTSCWKIYLPAAVDKNIALSVTASIPNDFIIYESKRLLETIIINFVSLGIRFSPAHTRLTLNAELSNKSFVMVMNTKMSPYKDETYNLMYSDSENVLGFKLIQKIADYTKGFFSKEILSNGVRFTISIPYIEGENRGLVVKDPSISFMPDKVINKLNLTKYKKDKDGKIVESRLKILVYGTVLENCLIIKQLLDPYADITIANTQMEVINLFSQNSSLFDITIGDFKEEDFKSSSYIDFYLNTPYLHSMNTLFIIPPECRLQADELIAHGSCGYISKPFTERGLLLRIQELLNIKYTALCQLQNSFTDITPKLLFQKNKNGNADESQGLTVKNKTPLKQMPAVIESEDSALPVKLSKREKEIVNLISQGKSDKEIAEELNISFQTVQTHNKNIFKKMDVHSRIELINKLR